MSNILLKFDVIDCDDNLYINLTHIASIINLLAINPEIIKFL